MYSHAHRPNNTNISRPSRKSLAIALFRTAHVRPSEHTRVWGSVAGAIGWQHGAEVDLLGGDVPFRGCNPVALVPGAYGGIAVAADGRVGHAVMRTRMHVRGDHPPTTLAPVVHQQSAVSDHQP
eukprot:1040355-Prymnesium_polylepis.2